VKKKTKIRKKEEEEFIMAHPSQDFSMEDSQQNPPKKQGRGRPKKAPTTLPTTSTMQVPTQNGYAQLNPDVDITDDESMNDFTSQSSKRRRVSTIPTPNDVQSSEKSSPKPPPHTIKDESYKMMQNIFDTAKISRNDYQMKFITKGIRVFSTNDKVHKLIDEKLKEEKKKYFTHLSKDQQTTKIVLHGLYKMEEAELQAKLNDEGFQPSKVKIMKIKAPKHNDHCVYLLHFPKNLKVKISDLRQKIKAIDQVIVRWEYFKNKRTGPIQCTNCMQFGHGSQCCFLDPMCVRCGGKHPSKECELLKDPTTNEIRKRIDDAQLKCGLCGQNHAATYKNCQKRQDFISQQQLYRERTQRRNRQSNRQQQQPYQRQQHFIPAPQLNDFNFPPLHNTPRPGPTPIPQQQQQTNQDNDLFTPLEIFEIYKELSFAIRNAKTKHAQLDALMNVFFKFNNGFTR
jgi:hypothetical protein